jgi:cytochrome oxidase Cu insertion factor (SCO1/SenC/PrrC family)
LVSSSVLAQQKPAEPPSQKTSSTETAAGKYFPNHILYTQDNKPVHFYDDMLKGKVVLINFFFTTCTGICPPMTANLAKVQTARGAHVGKDVTMISISVDPETDKPEVLKKYAQQFKAQPGWYFRTGERQNVDWVLYKLGGYVANKTEHSSILIIGNEASGEWLKMLAMGKPTETAAAVIKLIESSRK